MQTLRQPALAGAVRARLDHLAGKRACARAAGDVADREPGSPGPCPCCQNPATPDVCQLPFCLFRRGVYIKRCTSSKATGTHLNDLFTMTARQDFFGPDYRPSRGGSAPSSTTASAWKSQRQQALANRSETTASTVRRTGMPFASIQVPEAANLPVRDEKAAARVALVTGGNKGIGRVIVADLARKGFTVSAMSATRRASMATSGEDSRMTMNH